MVLQWVRGEECRWYCSVSGAKKIAVGQGQGRQVVLQWVMGEQGRWYCSGSGSRRTAVGQGRGGQTVPLCEGCRTETQVGSPCCCLPFSLHPTCHCCPQASPAPSPLLHILNRPYKHTSHLACFLAPCPRC